MSLGNRLPDWWQEKKALLTGPAPQAAEPEEKVYTPIYIEAETRPAPDWADLSDEPWEPPEPVVTPTVTQAVKADDAEEEEDADQRDDTDGEGDATVSFRDRVKAARTALEGRSERPGFATPLTSKIAKGKVSPFQWYRSLRPEVKWAAYQGSGIVAGWHFGLIDYAFDVTQYIEQYKDPTNATVTAVFFGGAFLAWLVLDRRVRKWFWPIAWAVRAVTASAVLGIVLAWATP